MGPSQPPFCRPGISSAGAASAIWNSCDTASLVTIVAWTSRATSAAASHAGNSPSDAETATAPARRMGATTRRARRGATARRAWRRPPAGRRADATFARDIAGAAARGPQATCMVCSLSVSSARLLSRGGRTRGASEPDARASAQFHIETHPWRREDNAVERPATNGTHVRLLVMNICTRKSSDETVS